MSPKSESPKSKVGLTNFGPSNFGLWTKKNNMKKIIVLLAMTSIIACKTKKQAAETALPPPASTEQTSSSETSMGKTKGKVSHQYRATGCATVVIFKKDDVEITVIPKDKLPEKLDVDGLEIWFDYLPLRMHNPEGCNAGFPAELTNVKPAK
ncbi:MAG: hypothetical protein WCG32_05555 [Actinomycetes bacterium]